MKTRISSGELMDIGDCVGCGMADENFITKGFARTDITLSDKSRKYVTISCDNCKSYKGVTHRDAAGNALSVPNSLIGKYSPAIGKTIESAKDLSEHCKRKGLVQTGQVLGE
jgi:hypothetical protein